MSPAPPHTPTNTGCPPMQFTGQERGRQHLQDAPTLRTPPQRRQRAARCKPVRTSPRVGALGSRAIETESAASTELRGACQTASQNPRQSRSEAGIPRSAMGSDDKPVHDDTATLASGVRQSGPISSMGRSVGLSLCHPVRERDKHQGTQVLGKRQSPAPGRM